MKLKDIKLAITTYLTQSRMMVIAIAYNMALQILDFVTTVRSEQYLFAEKNPLLIQLAKITGPFPILGLFLTKLLCILILYFWGKKSIELANAGRNVQYRILGLSALAFFMSIIVLMNARLIYIL